MKFGRNIFFFLLLIGLLSGALVMLNFTEARTLMTSGWQVFPVTMESVTQLKFEYPRDQFPTITLTRKGEFWEMSEPFRDTVCDPAEMTKILDGIVGLRVRSTLEGQALTEANEQVTLTVSLPDTAYVCRIGKPLPMFGSDVLAETATAQVTLAADALNFLPASADALRTSVILPLPAERIDALEWRARELPFTRAQRLPSGNWSVTQPYPFEVSKKDLQTVLTQLTAEPIARYICSADMRHANALRSEPALVEYGLDEERSLRLTILLRGNSERYSIRLGNPDPQQAGNIFCLLNDAQAIVSVPATLREMFGANGPFVTDFLNVPVFGDFTEPTRILLRPAGGTPTELRKAEGKWQLYLPAMLPVDPTIIAAYHRKLLSLTGDITQTPLPSAPFATVTFGWDMPTPELTMELFEGDTPGVCLVRRMDTGRIYRVKRAALPQPLLERHLDVSLIDRAIVKLSADKVRRIANGTTVRRDLETREWEPIEAQQGYCHAANIEALLKTLEHCRAVRVIAHSAEASDKAASYGLQPPMKKLELDLTDTDALRVVLWFGKPNPVTGNVPLMVQGRPLIYEIPASDYKALLAPLVAVE